MGSRKVHRLSHVNDASHRDRPQPLKLSTCDTMPGRWPIRLKKRDLFVFKSELRHQRRERFTLLQEETTTVQHGKRSPRLTYHSPLTARYNQHRGDPNCIYPLVAGPNHARRGALWKSLSGVHFESMIWSRFLRKIVLSGRIPGYGIANPHDRH